MWRMQQLLLKSGGMDAVAKARIAFPSNKEIQGVWQKLSHVLHKLSPDSFPVSNPNPI
jgi:hypothetical protein